MARFMGIKSDNRRLRQNQIAKEIGIQFVLYNDIETISICFYLIKSHPIVIKKQDISNRENDLERPQMTSKDLNRPQKSHN